LDFVNGRPVGRIYAGNGWSTIRSARRTTNI
jgi:hypothetical protein